MYELTSGLLVLLFIALIVVFYALRKTKYLRFIVVVSFCFVASVMYLKWGAYADIRQLIKKKQQQAQVAEALKKYNGPEDIIKRMEQHLSQKPDSAKGWYLLGKLYASQQKFQKAEAVLAKAYALENHNIEIKMQYIEISYLANNQAMTDKIKFLLNEVLTQYPEQLDALNFAAMEAYNHKDYILAAKYWQKMLKLLPDGSKEKRAILSAIANAQTK